MLQYALPILALIRARGRVFEGVQRPVVALDGRMHHPTPFADVADLLVDRRDILDAMQRVGRLARRFEILQRLVVREHALRLVRRATRVAQRLLEVAGERVVMREVRRALVDARIGDLAGLRAEQHLERVADTLVQPAPADGIEFLVEHLADLVVGEREGLLRAGRGTDELRAARLVECVEQRVLVRRRRARELAKDEVLPQRGRGSQHVHGHFAQAVEPPADGLLHALRDRELVRFLAAPAAVLAIDLALLDERLDDLLDEKGIAFGLAEQHVHEVVGNARHAEQRREERRGIAAGQPPQRDARSQALAIPFHQRGGEQMRAVELDLAICREEQHPLVAQVAQQVVQERQRALVGPVHVVDEHQKAALGRERLQEAGGIVEQAQALLAR
jgi:hypothetical protein